MDISLVGFPDKDTLSQHHDLSLLRPWAEDPAKLCKISMETVLFQLTFCNLLHNNIKQIQEYMSDSFNLTYNLRISGMYQALS